MAPRKKTPPPAVEPAIIVPMPQPTHVHVDQLRVAPENPRSEADADDDLKGARTIEDLADSLVTQGVLTPLIAYHGTMSDTETFEGYWVTAGGRRTRALKHLVKSGRWPEDWTIPVIVLPRDRAIDAGITDETSHLALSEYDIIRAMQSPAVRHQDDRAVARQLGISMAEVKRKRAILTLPEEVVQAVLEQIITVDQAEGLSSVTELPGLFGQFFERAMQTPSFDAKEMRRFAKSHLPAWDDLREQTRNLVSPEAYQAAGGRFQTDLFTMQKLVLDTDILWTIRDASFIEQMKAEAPGWGAYVQVDEIYNAGERHYGVSGSTPDEKWPPGLKALLHVKYRLSEYGCEYATGFIPKENRPALIAAGYIKAPPTPEKGTPEAAAAAVDALPESLKEAISRITTQVARFLRLEDPDEVLADYLCHLNSRGYSNVYHHTEWTTADQLKPFRFKPSLEWLNCEAFRTHSGAALKAEDPHLQKRLLVWRILLLMQEPAFKHLPQIPTETLYRYWSPDEDFVKRYKADALRAAIATFEPETAAQAEKKGDLVRIAVQLIKQGTMIALPGFPTGDVFILRPALADRPAPYERPDYDDRDPSDVPDDEDDLDDLPDHEWADPDADEDPAVTNATEREPADDNASTEPALVA